jgi:selenocysteine lyase/cysteine desulfurase
MALMLALAPGRRRIVFPADGYYNTRALAARLRPHGAEAVAADLLDLPAVEAALGDGPSILWAETPTNPLLRVADLAALGELARAAGAPFVVDNTVATGLLQKPLEYGADALMYSLTKSVSGHSDVLGGAVVTRDEALAREVRAWRTSGVRSPGRSRAGWYCAASRRCRCGLSDSRPALWRSRSSWPAARGSRPCTTRGSTHRRPLSSRCRAASARCSPSSSPGRRPTPTGW